MKACDKAEYKWAVIGAGPAGLASVGILLEQGVCAKDILMIDPHFQVGDFGSYWGEVYSNTTVELFLAFLQQIKGFAFAVRPKSFKLESLPLESFCQLKMVSEVLLWVTQTLRKTVPSVKGYASRIDVNNGMYSIQVNKKLYLAEKVIVAIGSEPKSLKFNDIEEISLYTALTPTKLNSSVKADDTIAVFGSSHSSMIIMKNLLDSGVKQVHNYYLTPHRYALKMDSWTLYDNTGLKGDTAAWVRQNIDKTLDPRIKRYLSNDANLVNYLPLCNKAVYPIGFNARTLLVPGVNITQYDNTNGIIAPGLFGVGIAFPRQVVDPMGNVELNVGLYKFMQDIRSAMPLWMKSAIQMRAKLS